ncbi:MAG: hypothetical protein JNM75_08930 [Rhodospirillales bacterium]|nr:hypothetical protein [Rhodospirillales bacterium]
MAAVLGSPPAQARIDLPSKAVVAMVFMNCPDYVDQCPPKLNGYSAREMIDNYKASVKDMADAGVRVAAMDTFPGAGRAARVGYFATAVKEYNNEHPGTDFCQFPVYDLAGWKSADVIDVLKKSDASGTNCVKDGQPIIGAWNTKVCDSNYYLSNVINPIKQAGLGTPYFWGYFHPGDINAFKTSVSNCKQPFAKAGVPFSWFQFFSGNPAHHKNQENIKAAADPAGVLFAPGIPTSRASNCSVTGACAPSAKTSRPAFMYHNGFEGFVRAWRAALPGGALSLKGPKPIDYVWLTMWSDYGEDALHSPALDPDPARPAYRKAATPFPFFRYSYSVSNWTHRGFWRLDKAFSEWFLSGRKPDTQTESIEWAYRQHPANLPAPAGDFCKSATPSVVGTAGGALPPDRVYVTSLLNAPADLYVQLDGTTTGPISLPAGQAFANDLADIQTWADYGRNRLGTPHFVLKRDLNGDGRRDEVAWEGDGLLEITDRPLQWDGKSVSRNFNHYADYADLPDTGEDFPDPPADDDGLPLRINAGSSGDLSSAGLTWAADRGFIGGASVDRGPIAVANAADERIYRTERWGLDGYTLPLPVGMYAVRLHFAETSAGVVESGKRVFSVDVEGRRLDNLDVFAEAGGARKALVKTFDNVIVRDGELDIAFERKLGEPMIDALEVEPLLACPASAL